MAQQLFGKQRLLTNQYDTYEHWRAFCLQTAINVDLAYGNQCWDSCCLLWVQYGLWLYTGNGYAYGCYAIERDRNAVPPFSKVTRKVDIKRGDCIVFAPVGLNYTGHIGFADEDYNGTDYINCLGQNQGQGTGFGKASNVVQMYLGRFMGGFRNSNWYIPPTPIISSTPEDKRFPWAIYTNRFRNGIR